MFYPFHCILLVIQTLPSFFMHAHTFETGSCCALPGWPQSHCLLCLNLSAGIMAECSHVRITLCFPELKYVFLFQIRISWKRVMPTELWESIQNLNCEKKIQELLGVGSLMMASTNLTALTALSSWVMRSPLRWDLRLCRLLNYGLPWKAFHRLSPGLEGGMEGF